MYTLFDVLKLNVVNSKRLIILFLNDQLKPYNL